MSTKAKFDPSRVASLLSRGAEEGRAPFDERPAAPVLSAVPEMAIPEAKDNTGPGTDIPAADAGAAVSVKRPITVRLTEEVLHALVRHQAEVRCKPGARLGDTTIGGVIDSLLRGPLGLS